MMCPGGCGNEYNSTQHVLCRECWRKVPKRVQESVYNAYSARLFVGSPETVQAHERAKGVAIVWAQR